MQPRQKLILIGAFVSVIRLSIYWTYLLKNIAGEGSWDSLMAYLFVFPELMIPAFSLGLWSRFGQDHYIILGLVDSGILLITSLAIAAFLRAMFTPET